MSDFGTALITLLADMEKQRENANKAPSAVLLRDFMSRVRQELAELESDGAITIGRTLNDSYIKTNGTKQVR